MIDVEKRKRVMARSMQLGHCICDPKKSCPCDVLRDHNVCPCAGERLETVPGEMRLTDLVERPGCASKIDAAALRRILAELPEVNDPRVLVGMPAGDDAGVYRLDGNVALVQTVDVFSPSVDDPYVFGQIAAANSVSDIYAMGGRPITALSIVGFPVRSLPDEVLQQILRGGIDKMNEAGVAVIGGHSINEREIKAGFAVTGLIEADKVFTNAGLQPGDRLILTKPLGTGVLAFAAQIHRAPEGALDASARSMAQLNRTAAELMVELGAHACTDVTGFGLMGHLGAMASASGMNVEVMWDDLPVLPGVLQCLADGIISGAVERNREASEQCVRAAEGVDAAMLDLCFDAQTSGGLLIAMKEADAPVLLRRLHAQGVTEATQIGYVSGPGPGEVTVCTNGSRQMPSSVGATGSASESATGSASEFATGSASESATGSASEFGVAGPALAAPVAPLGHSAECCSDVAMSAGPAAPVATNGSEAESKFHEFMKAANAPGLLDARTKKAMAIALSVITKCEPCLKSHIAKAREMGFSQEEIDEAAWLAIAFGGAPLMMFYKALRRTE